MSDTPMTDAAFDAMTEIPRDLYGLRESMRKLECERNELLAELEESVAADDRSVAELGLVGYEHPSTARARAVIAKVKGQGHE